MYAQWNQAGPVAARWAAKKSRRWIFTQRLMDFSLALQHPESRPRMTSTRSPAATSGFGDELVNGEF